MEQTMKQKKPVLPEEEKNRTRSRRNKRIKQFLPLYIMLLPGIVYLIINNYLPMGGLVIAFKKVNYAVGIFNSPWAGLSNFKFLFSNNDALNALRATQYCTIWALSCSATFLPSLLPSRWIV